MSNKKTNFLGIENLILEEGFSIIEVILAVSIFVIFSSGAIVAIISGINNNRLGAEVTIANQFNAEGIEAVRSIKNQSFATLAGKAGLGNQGVAISGSVWTFSGTSNSLPSDTRFVRTIVITSVQRDTSGNIVASGGTVDGNSFKIVTTTAWNFNSARQNSVVLTSYMTNWKAKKGGMLVYGDGGTTTDAIKYRILNGATGTWNTAAATADVDGATTNKALRAARLYASSTRNEKILISRHYNGTTQFIYAQVFNGSTWGSVQLLSSWTATTFLDVQNFDGTYLNNGNFMVVYSDNTVIPKSRIWDGTTWQTQTSLTTLGASQIPSYIITSARSGSNEVMAVFFTQGGALTSGNTITQYYNAISWSAITTHATASPNNTLRAVDFAWSGTTPTVGALVYAASATEKALRVKSGTASGGVFTWGTEGSTGLQTQVIGSFSIAPRPNTANQFIACAKDAQGTSLRVICYIVTHALTPTFSGGTVIISATNTLIERSFHTAYKTASISGNIGIAVAAVDASNQPELNILSSSGTWNAGTLLTITGFTAGALTSIRLIPQDQGSDVMLMMSDLNKGLYSVVYNGETNAVYTSPAGKTFSQHGTNGSATNEFWFDFTWDKF